MNDIAKESISSKLIKALESEQLSTNDGSKILGIKAIYASMIKNPKSWHKCPLSAFETALLWVNSGETLRNYAVKNGIDLTPVVREKKIKSESKEITQPEKPIKINVLKPILTQSENQKVVIDIEINILVNGKKITL